MWLCSYVAMWLCGFVAVLLCSYVAIWLYRYVAMWLCGQFETKFRKFQKFQGSEVITIKISKNQFVELCGTHTHTLSKTLKIPNSQICKNNMLQNDLGFLLESMQVILVYPKSRITGLGASQNHKIPQLSKLQLTGR